MGEPGEASEPWLAWPEPKIGESRSMGDDGGWTGVWGAGDVGDEVGEVI